MCGFYTSIDRNLSLLSMNLQNKREKDANSDVKASDRIPQLIICATMWHETEDEMIEFLKSIIRLDEDQCARRMAKNYLFKDEGYYELESEYIYILFWHSFFRLYRIVKKTKTNFYPTLGILKFSFAQFIIL